MGSKPEPAIWSRDTGQRISWYDSCQLHIICMSNINDICCNPTLHDLVLAGWPPCCATSFVVVVVVVVVGRTRPWSMPLAILTKRKELHGFLFLCIRVVPFSIIMGLRLAALRAAGAPLITIIIIIIIIAIVIIIVWYWTSMLWSIDTCQKQVSADQYHMTISRAQVYSSSRSCVFFEVDRWPSSGFWLDRGLMSG